MGDQQGRASSDRTPGDSNGDRGDGTPERPEPTADETPPDSAEPTGEPEPGIPPKYHDLLRAAEQGPVRVIVTMRLESTPEPAAERRQAIANTADELFDEMAEFDVSKGHIYRNFPMFAAEVDEPALRHLIRSDRVLRISEDKLEKPQ